MSVFARLVVCAALVSACSVYEPSLLRESVSGSGGAAAAGGALVTSDASAGAGGFSFTDDASAGASLGGGAGADGSASRGGSDGGLGRPDGAVPSCHDGIANGAETDVDCGGTCSPCAGGSTCAASADCASKLCVGRVCTNASCTDSVKNGSESDVDCGGACAACATGYACATGADCVSEVCSGDICQVASCRDGVRNGIESDVDCGGPCSACPVGKACRTGSDCTSGACSGDACTAPSCSDGVNNGAETDVDCGGGTCPVCANGKRCTTGVDCTSTFCSGGVCTPPGCNDGVKNGTETSVDCGGPSCGPCADGATCGTGADCASKSCAAGQCVAATCSDTIQNGAETGIDCGGGSCGECGVGQGCSTGSDCTSGVCTDSQCHAPSCSDSVKNGTETSVDCGGGSCSGCAAGASCVTPGDCLSNVCTSNLCQAATCSDGVKNGAETGIDCGGTCLPCGFRKTLTIQGAQVTASLVDFPVLVSVADAQFGAAARTDGTDIVFRDDSGTVLDLEVESFTSATGRLTAWVRLPLVSAGTNTVFYMYYGDTANHWNAASGYNPTGVWSNGYTRVWHMQNVAALTDSTGAGNATNNGAANTTGLIGGAAYFDGTDSMYASHAAIDGASFTVSVWLKRADTDVDRCVLTQGRISTAPGTRQLFHLCYEQDPSPAINNHFRFGFWSDDLLSTNAYTDTTNYEYWVGTYDVSSNARALYRNGASEGSGTSGGSLSTGSDPLEFGRRVYWWDYTWKGNLDEIRFSSVPRPGNWIAAEYANERAGSTFLTVGAQEAL